MNVNDAGNRIHRRETMTSRQRVLDAINHKPVDRMPIDLGMYFSTGISAFAYWNLREYLGLPVDNIEIADMVQFLPRVAVDILERFHCDCILLQPAWPETHRWNPRGRYSFIIPETAQPHRNENGDWIVEHNGRMRMPENGYFFDGEWLGFDNMLEDEIIEITVKEAERIYKETGYFTTHTGFSAFFNELDIEWQCRMLTDPEDILWENRLTLDYYIKTAGKIIDSMGQYIQGIWVGSDLGSQSAPLCRPSLYDELCAPFLEEFCSFIHRNSDLKIFMHSCGSIKPLIPTIIDCGIDVLNPIQISADNMDPWQLKKEFGSRITFWGGGCDTQNVLNRGTPGEVEDNVRKLVGIFKPGSGYVFNPVHNIMGDITPENIVAMYDTAYNESFYYK